MSHPCVHALIPAAGLSVRFGGTTLKQYAHLLGKPVIAHSIDAVSLRPRVSGVTVILAQDDGIYDELVRPDYPGVDTVTGGESRAKSVLHGVLHIRENDPECEWVLVHDAARPCLSERILRELLRLGLASDCGAILAIPVSDTLKRSDNENRIETTVDREGMWAAQTPQLFRVRDLVRNLEAALSFGEAPTDEAEAMERSGYHPLLVMGSPNNIKITGPDDLAIAGAILSHRLKRK